MEKDFRSGHRERLRKRYLETGLKGFAPHEVLELLLQFSIPRKDTKQQAYNLIRKFGNINNVFCASEDLLTKVDGIGDSSALLINLVRDVISYCDAEKIKDVKRMTVPREFGEYAVNLLSHCVREEFYVLAFDGTGRLLYTKNIGWGTVYEVLVKIKDIITVAVESRASGIVLAHNHPSGVLEPSNSDIETTSKINDMLRDMQITLLDHIIVCDRDYVSFAELGML